MLSVKAIATIIILFAVLLALLLGYQYLAQKLGINTQPRQPQQPVINNEMLFEYRRICEVLMECIRGNAVAFALSRPCDMMDHLLLPEEGIRVKNNRLFFVYQFSREITSSPLSEKREYSTMPVEEITRLINTRLRCYCLKYGAPPVVIYKALDGADGAIRFVVGAWR